jgi:hypothetical protein
LGHRRSIDLDFFGSIDMNGTSICKILTDAEFDALSERDATNIHIFKVNNVKVDMVNFPFEWLESPIEIEKVPMPEMLIPTRWETIKSTIRQLMRQ